MDEKDRTYATKSDIDQINKRLDKINDVMNAEAANTTYHIKAIHAEMTKNVHRMMEIYKIISPDTYKNFPSISEDFDSINSILKASHPKSNDKSDR